MMSKMYVLIGNSNIKFSISYLLPMEHGTSATLLE